MRSGVPARVLIARLAHELEGVRLAFNAKDYDKAIEGLRQCNILVDQIKEAV